MEQAKALIASWARSFMAAALALYGGRQFDFLEKYEFKC